MSAALKQAAIAMLAVEQIDASPHNPRKTFGDLDELTASIKEKGVLSPVLVRPLGERFELVFGERRWRAAVRANAEAIPAMVRELSDQEALELMIVENAQREDVNPHEEAEGYRSLHETYGYSVEQIAAKVSKSKRVVYERLQLCKLASGLRTSALSLSILQLVARLPEALQEEAAKKIEEGDYGGPMTYEEARDFLLADYTLALSEAPWSLKDANLVPSAGACSSCPKRTGNQPELFAEVKAKDTCTDPGCFKEKKTAFVKLELDKAQAAGKSIASAAEAKRALKSGEVLDLDERRWNPTTGKDQSLREQLGKKLAKLDTTLAPAAAGLQTLVRAEDVKKLLPKAKPVPPAHDWQAEQEKRKKERERNGKVATALVAEIVKKAETKGIGKAAWFTLADAQIRHDQNEDLVRARLGREPNSDAEKDEADLRTLAAKMTVEQLQALVLHGALLDHVYEFTTTTKDGFVREMARIFGVDEKKVVDQTKAELAAEKKALEKGVVDDQGEASQSLPAEAKKKPAPKKAVKKKPAGKKK